MSRGHKILQTFLQKRGAWDNNPYKEPEMKKPEPPFVPDKNPKKFAVAGKAGYGPSAARHLARKGLEQMLKLNPKLKETWSDSVLDQLAEGYIDYTRPSGAAYDATMVKGKMVITPNKPYEPYGAAPAKKKVTKLPMSQAAGALAAEAKVYDPITKKMVATKPIKVQAGGGATRNGVPVETGPSKYKSKLPMSKAAGALAAEAVTYTGMGTDVVDKKKKLNPQPNLIMKPKQVKDFKEETIAEGKMKEIYTSMMDHADKKGYSSHKQFKKADYESVGKKHGISGGDVAIVAGHHTADSYSKLKEENLDELKASTLQSYADKAHQQAQDATYDAAHLNRTGEEKFKAAAKRLASKRAGGVQMAQTKLDKMTEALELPHSMGDAVRCTRTNRMATVAGFDNDKYTVVYGDGSTETGAADEYATVHKVNQSNSGSNE